MCRTARKVRFKVVGCIFLAQQNVNIVSTESVFGTGDAVSWHLDGVKFKKNSKAEPLDPCPPPPPAKNPAVGKTLYVYLYLCIY